MKYLKTLLFEFIILVIPTFVITILYYFNIISNNTNNILKILIFLITFFASGIYIGKFSNKKYYLEGIKLSLINIILFLILSLIFKYDFNFKQILYYLIILIITTIGSITMGNKKKNKN